MKSKILIIIGFITCVFSMKAQVEISSGGIGTAYTLTVPSAFSLRPGIQVTFKANVVCDSAPTINVNSTGAILIKKEGGTTVLSANDIRGGQVVNLAYDGTFWQMLSASGSTVPSSNSVWSLTGNTGTAPASNFLGTTDSRPLIFKTLGEERMKITIGGKVGIGTSNPNFKTEIISDSTGTTNTVLRLSTLHTNSFVDLEGSGTGSGDFRIRSNGGSSGLTFQTNGVNDRMKIDAGGNVGIGTGTINYLLDVNSGTDVFANISSRGSAVGTLAGIRLSMFVTGTGMHYDLSSEKNDAIVNSGASDLVLRQHYSTAGGYVKIMKVNQSNSDITFNESKTTAGAYGNFIVANGKVGIGTSSPDVSSILDLTDTTKGILIPRMTLGQRNGIAAPATGLLVYNTGSDKFNYWNGTAWKIIGFAPANPEWSTAGNAGTNVATDYLGTSDAVGLGFRTSGIERMKIDATGNVGIGIATPDVTLHSVGSTNAIFSNSATTTYSGGGKMYPGAYYYATILGGGGAWSSPDGGGMPGGKFIGGNAGTNYGGGGAGVVAIGGNGSIFGRSGAGIYARAGVDGGSATDGVPAVAGYFDGNGTNAIIAMAGNVGIGTLTPVNMFSVGTTSQFQINATGNILKVNDIATSFPATQGVAGTILQNDGSGNLSWADPNSTGPWTKSGSNIYQTTLTDNVGIGIASPLAKLHLGGNSELRIGDATANLAQILRFYTPGAGYQHIIEGGGDNNGLIIRSTMQGGADALSFDTYNAAASGFLNRFKITGGATTAYVSFSNSNVGIGTLTPVNVFSVGATSQFQINATGNILKINDIATSFPATQGVAGTLLKNDGSGNLSWADPNSTGPWTKSGAYLFPTTLTDSVGIGTNTPTEKFHVSQIKDANKNAIYGYAKQTGTSADYQNTGVAGFGEGTAAGGFGFGIGVKGVGSTNSYGAIGVYAGLNTSVPIVNVPSNYYALYSDAGAVAANRFAGVFMNGNVGIGTTLPINKLDVEGAVAIGVAYSGTTAAPANGMIVEGNVGIGTAAPSMRLDVRSNYSTAPYTAQFLNSATVPPASMLAGIYGLSDGANVGGITKYGGIFQSANGAGTNYGLKAEAINGTGTNIGGYFGASGGAVNYAIIVPSTGGNVGIGTTAPAQKLEVTGNIMIPAANDYMYKTAKTDYFTVSSAGFGLSGVSSSEVVGGFATGNSKWMTGGVAGTATVLTAPVNLPNGSIVTGITATVSDADVSYEVSVNLMRATLGSTIISTIATTTTSGIAFAAGTTTLTANPSVAIDNSLYAYYLKFNTMQANANLRIFNVQITYTITNAN